mgnify:CR=1 FL=1
MTTTQQHSIEQVRRAASDRANARLPLTFLGTLREPGSAIPEVEQGWQQHMWSHHAFVTGSVWAAGVAVHEAVNAGILASPWRAAASAVSIGLLAAAGGLLATAGERFTTWARAYFVATPAAAGAYLAAVAHTSPFSTGSLIAVAAGTAVGMGMYYQMRTQQDAYELRYVSRFASVSTTTRRPAQAVTAAPVPVPLQDYERDPELRRWTAALTAVGLRGCKAVRIKEDLPAGFAVLVELSATGKASPESVGAQLQALERNLKLPRECLDFDIATSQDGRELSHRCWIIVDTEDILSQVLDMPGDTDDQEHGPTTVNEAFRIGTFMDGTPMTLRMREISALIVGLRGRGKTNLFTVIVHQLSRCTDCCLWVVDLKGGRAVKPWLAPWLDRRSPRPVFDWVATTRLEATLMISAAYALITYRGNASKGGAKLEPTPENPGVLILVDESSALVGKHSGGVKPKDPNQWWRNASAAKIGNVTTLVVQLGRSEAVDVVFFTQRATVTMAGGGDLKSQCEMRIGMGVANAGDAKGIFQNNNIAAKKLNKLKLKSTRGACLIENGEDTNHLIGKTWFYGEDNPKKLRPGQMSMTERIDRAAVMHASYPAELSIPEQEAVDEALMALTNGEYGYGVGDDRFNQRWSKDRSAHLYRDDLEPEWVDTGDDDEEPTSSPAGTATATAAQPASAPPATRPGPHPPTYDRTAMDKPTSTPNRFFTSKRGRPTQPVSAVPDPARDNLDPEEQLYQDKFDAIVAFYAEEPTAPEDAYDLEAEGQQSSYNLMLDLIREADAGGIMPGAIEKEMRHQKNFWAKRQQIYPALKKAKKAGLITQPVTNGPYYWAPTAPGRMP